MKGSLIRHDQGKVFKLENMEGTEFMSSVTRLERGLLEIGQLKQGGYPIKRTTRVHHIEKKGI